MLQLWLSSKWHTRWAIRYEDHLHFWSQFSLHAVLQPIFWLFWVSQFLRNTRPVLFSMNICSHSASTSYYFSPNSSTGLVNSEALVRTSSDLYKEERATFACCPAISLICNGNTTITPPYNIGGDNSIAEKSRTSQFCRVSFWNIRSPPATAWLI